MPEYLSKEEVKQWRSSLEKITLEEYAARLGKVIEEEKHTNDLVDIVLKGKSVVSKEDTSMTKSERISAVAQRSFEREREISHSPFAASVTSKKMHESASKAQKVEKTEPKAEKTEQKSLAQKAIAKVAKEKATSSTSAGEIVFSKSLTEREQMVFDYFANNKGQVVYAKDLAALLNLPRDYVYKYIKNLRAKIEGDKLQNSDNGGYVLQI